MNILGLIPARGGSKGIPRKNIRTFIDRPLIAWTIEAARQSGVCDRVLVSTDDDEIARVARRFGADVPFLRPAALAGDEVLTAPVIRHAVEWLAAQGAPVPDWVFVLEPTAPSRRFWHLQQAAKLLEREQGDSLASVSRVPQHYVPSKQLTLKADGTLTGVDGSAIRYMIHRRQELPASYAFNGLLFACRSGVLRQEPPTLWGERVLAYVTDEQYTVDLDDPEQWPAAEARVRRLLEEERSAVAVGDAPLSGRR